MAGSDEVIGTEEAARRLGMSPDWVRRQVVAGRLKATVWLIGKRPTYRIRVTDLDDFRRRYSQRR
jgi:excisionase family DNA binding protein